MVTFCLCVSIVGSNLSPLKVSENQSKSNNIDSAIIADQIKNLELFVKDKDKSLIVYNKIIKVALGTACIEKSIQQQLE